MALVPGNPDLNTASGANAGAYDPAGHRYLVWRDNLGGSAPQFTNLFSVDTATGAPTSVCSLQTRSNAQDFTFQGGFLWALARETSRNGWPSRATAVLLLAVLGATLSRAGLSSFVALLVVLSALLGFGVVWRAVGMTVLGAWSPHLLHLH